MCLTLPRSYRSHHWMGQGNRGYSIHTCTWNIPLNMSFSMRNNKNRIIPITLSVSLSLYFSMSHLCVFISCLYSPQNWGLNWAKGGGGRGVFASLCLEWHREGGVGFTTIGHQFLWCAACQRTPEMSKHSKPHPSGTPKTNTRYSLAQICSHYLSFSVAFFSPPSFTLS